MATGSQKQIEQLQAELKHREQRLREYQSAASASLAEKDNLIAEMDARLTTLRGEMETVRGQIRNFPTVQPAQQVFSNLSIGSIEGYQRSTDWNQWVRRLEHFMSGNAIPESRRKDLFLNLLGPEGYALISSLCAPELPGDGTYEQLIEIMTTHLKPKPSVITERYRFNMCEQTEGQTVSEFLANLKRLSTYCEFGSNLNDVIRDRFVCGLRIKTTKKKLLSEKQLTYERAIEIAISDEAATRDTSEIDQYKSQEPVNYVTNQQQGSRKFFSRNCCTCCGRRGHWKNTCRFKDYSCDKCKRKGHLASVCQSNRDNNNRPSGTSNSKENKSVTNRIGNNWRGNEPSHNYLDEILDLDQSSDELLFAIGEEELLIEEDLTNSSSKPIKMSISIQGKEVELELDTGSPISAISSNEYNENAIFNNLTLFDTDRKFKSYTGSPIIPLGFLKVDVSYNGRKKNLELFVLPGSSKPILGREWIGALRVFVVEKDNNEIKKVSSVNNLTVEELKDKFSSVLTDQLGLYKHGRFKLELKENVTPVFVKPRVLPYAMINKVDKEIDRLVKDDIIFPVESSEWATPIVPIIKTTGQLRLCGDYKITLNKFMKVDRYPIPRISDLLAKINKGKCFSRIDLSHAYQQVELDEESKLLTTISTHRGLFAYKRLCFGVSSAPGLFQRMMEKLLFGIAGVILFFDDILVFGSTWSEHDERLLTVLNKLKNAGLTAKLSKCEFFKSEINFLGFRIDGKGLHVLKDKVQAIIEIKPPQNVTELKRFLGMANYYAKFIKNYSQTAAPLYFLLKKDVKWSWSEKYQRAFNEVKKKLVSSEVLVHYDPGLPIKITCDASSDGIGAVLSHIIGKNECKPIAFFSRALTKAEKNYSQLDREALALVFGVKSCHQYVWGRKFLLETDHKPLKYIFDSSRSLPTMVAGRVQRWAVFLTAYDFVLQHIEGKQNVTADCLSRSPMLLKEGDEMDDYSYLNFVETEVKLLDSMLISSETMRDNSLSKILDYVRNGWPKVIDDLLETYRRREKELYSEGDCLMLGSRVVIPESLRGMVLKELHSTHMGIVKMKGLARSYVWWPGIDSDIEKITKQCKYCLENSSNPPRSELHPWKWPEGPNIRIHIDFLQIDDKMFLIIIDAFSKWMDVRIMKNITSKQTISILMEYFATWGLPTILVSDNGPSLVSDEFEFFLKELGILHVRTAPYHPASNGAAENAVRTFKKHFKLLVKEGFPVETALNRFLFSYRSTPHCTTGCSPAELQLGRPMRIKLDLMKPNIRSHVLQQQMRQKHFAPGSTVRSFDTGDIIMAKDFMQKNWRKGKILRQESPVTYTIRTVDGQNWKRHVDHLRGCDLPMKPETNSMYLNPNVEKILVPSFARSGETKNCSLRSESSNGREHEGPESCNPERSLSERNTQRPPTPSTAESLVRIPAESTAPVDTPTADPCVGRSGATVQVVRRSTRVSKPVQRIDL